MLTWAVSFLFIAIFAGIFGFITIGPAGMIVFAAFFIAFIWALVEHFRRGRSD